MKNTIVKFSAVGVIALSAGACVNLDYPISTVDGSTARNNFSAQVIDPETAAGAPEMDAAMVDAAVDRYRKGEIKQANEESETQALQLNFTPGN